MSALNFVETGDNRAPAGGEIRMLQTADGVAIRTAFWPAREGKKAGTILILQGRAEFLEKYFEVVDELLERGFAVVAFDWRGQGRSGRSLADGRKGHVRHFDDFRHDLEAVRTQVLDPLGPAALHVLAHSMGGCIALIGAAEGWLRADRMVVTTPMIALSIVRHRKLVGMLASLLSFFRLGGRFVPGGRPDSISTEPFEGNRLSRDERRYARNAAVAALMGEAAIGSPTIGWLRSAYAAMAKLEAPGYASRVRIPTLMVGAGDDPVCSTAVIEMFGQALGPESRYLLIPEARHEVLMESDAIRQQFWTAFDAFVSGNRGEPSAVKPLEDVAVQHAVAAGHD